MDNYVMLGYLLYALDGLYLDNFTISDDDRQRIEEYLYKAFDEMTEEEARAYYFNMSNSNLK